MNWPAVRVVVVDDVQLVGPDAEGGEVRVQAVDDAGRPVEACPELPAARLISTVPETPEDPVGLNAVTLNPETVQLEGTISAAEGRLD